LPAICESMLNECVVSANGQIYVVDFSYISLDESVFVLSINVQKMSLYELLLIITLLDMFEGTNL